MDIIENSASEPDERRFRIFLKWDNEPDTLPLELDDLSVSEYLKFKCKKQAY